MKKQFAPGLRGARSTPIPTIPKTTSNSGLPRSQNPRKYRIRNATTAGASMSQSRNE
jgi:hypothetical protein